MTEEKSRQKFVWVFSGPHNHFPSAVFSSRDLAEEWVEKYQLRGTLTAYPLDLSVWEWAIERGYFIPKREEQTSSNFIGNFSSASQEHYHYGPDED
jgi:hypothetical protein